MKNWYHEVSVEWLKERRNVITATEIASLLPEYKRMQKKESGVLSPGSAALWCAKHTDTDIDTESKGAMARGHVLEPWAIKEWNRQAKPEHFHWDDCIICRNGVGFSPDGCDVPMHLSDAKLSVTSDNVLVNDDGETQQAPTSILEIKSYEPAHHMKCVIEDKKEHKELWQVAVAFYVVPCLEEAKIIWFCPDSPIPMWVEEYKREDLEEQLKIIDGIVDMYFKTAGRCEQISSKYTVECTEDQIYMKYLQDLDDTELREVYLF